MKNWRIKKILSNDRGITLVALIVTIIVILILTGVSMEWGGDSLNSTQLQGFFMELEIIQKRVDTIASTNESYVEGTTTYYIKEQGTAFANLDDNRKAQLSDIIATEGNELNIEPSAFRYFTISQLEQILDLPNMRYNVYIDFDTRTIISEEGVSYNGKTYHILINNMYHVNQDKTQNEKSIELNYSVSKYGSNNYKIIVTPINAIGNIYNGKLRYKKSTSQYWENATNLEIVVSSLTQYDIEYEDSNRNKISESIQLELDGTGTPIITK